MQPTVYIMASEQRGTLYVGVTSNLTQRAWQHKQGLAEGFSQKYETKSLVYFEQHESMEFGNFKRKADKEMASSMEIRSNFQY